MLRFQAPPPLSLYVHFPWCVRKCPYCDFNSWTMGEEAPLDAYLQALLRDLALEADRVAPHCDFFSVGTNDLQVLASAIPAVLVANAMPRVAEEARAAALVPAAPASRPARPRKHGITRAGDVGDDGLGNTNTSPPPASSAWAA